MTLPNTLGVDLRLRNIQEIRLAASLLESSARLHFPSEAREALTAWTRYFGGEFSIGLDGVPIIDPIAIDHQTPTTRVGPLRRTLLFPRGMIQRCQTLWAEVRPFTFSFAGLPTPTRRETLLRWARTHFGPSGEAVRVPSMPRGPRLWLSHLLKGYYEYRGHYTELGLLISFSDRGRRFPVKVWDESYFKDLARSRFVLCPNGDFVWTYRFFEAVLCGAIPVIEETCEAYRGYTYFTMATPLHELRYSSDVARSNFQRAATELSVAPGDLDATLELLLDEKRSMVRTVR